MNTELNKLICNHNYSQNTRREKKICKNGLISSIDLIEYIWFTFLFTKTNLSLMLPIVSLTCKTWKHIVEKSNLWMTFFRNIGFVSFGHSHLPLVQKLAFEHGFSFENNLEKRITIQRLSIDIEDRNVCFIKNTHLAVYGNSKLTLYDTEKKLHDIVLPTDVIQIHSDDISLYALLENGKIAKLNIANLISSSNKIEKFCNLSNVNHVGALDLLSENEHYLLSLSPNQIMVWDKKCLTLISKTVDIAIECVIGIDNDIFYWTENKGKRKLCALDLRNMKTFKFDDFDAKSQNIYISCGKGVMTTEARVDDDSYDEIETSINPFKIIRSEDGLQAIASNTSYPIQVLADEAFDIALFNDLLIFCRTESSNEALFDTVWFINAQTGEIVSENQTDPINTINYFQNSIQILTLNGEFIKIEFATPIVKEIHKLEA